ncbi:MAG: M3 family oligoendopeptidase [Halanaerobiales bacterium]|nr:M3 family oligoendopeptidase [Halanaerobiales bacterium]
MSLTNEKLLKKQRKYYLEDLDVTKWEVVEKEWQILLEEPISSANDLEVLLEKYSELNSILMDEMSWRYIKMTLHADQDEYSKSFNDFYAKITCNSETYDSKVKKKYYENEFRKELSEERYGHLDKIISNDIELFREENVPLKVKEQETFTKYNTITSSMTVNYKGEEKTLQQLSVYLKDKDRSVREEVWHLVMDRLAQDADELNKVFDELKEIRIEIAKNAGFDNYRDYMHKEKGRFSYTPDDLYRFHDVVEKFVVPFMKELNEERKEKLELDVLRPWDINVDYDGEVLKPFNNVDEFVDKAINVLSNVKPEFGIKLNKMKNSDFLDLENRKGKAPGGYCASIEEYGSSFIFMNAVGLHSDVTTLVHEAGHAMHSFEKVDEPIFQYKHTPEEASELASMSMEFMTMDYWGEYYADPKDLKKAKRDQLIGTLKFLPWCMVVDAFQHWIYTNPDHTPEERLEYFTDLSERFNTGVDWTGLGKEQKISWMRQLHIFEVPFYYIEYGIAQLGALAVYKNYKENPHKAVEDYEAFLKLGYSKPVNELYEAAGVKFDFSEEYIKEIVDFVKAELKSIY